MNRFGLRGQDRLAPDDHPDVVPMPSSTCARLFDWQIVDGSQPQAHQPVLIELPILIAIRAKPIPGVVAPFIGKAHRDMVPLERPKLFDQPIVQLFCPFASQKRNDSFPATPAEPANPSFRGIGAIRGARPQLLTGCAARSLDFIMDRQRRLGFPSRSPLRLAAHVPLGVFRIPVAFCWQAEGENRTPSCTVGDTNGSSVRLDNHFRYRQAHAGARQAIPYILSSIEFLEDMLDFLFFDPRPQVRDTNVMELVTLLCRDRDGLTLGRVELRVGDELN